MFSKIATAVFYAGFALGTLFHVGWAMVAAGIAAIVLAVIVVVKD